MSLEVGEGYRLLDPEIDVLKAGDEVDLFGWKLVRPVDYGRLVRSVNFATRFRRKVEPADGWIKLSERLPSEFPCQVAVLAKVQNPVVVTSGFSISGTRLCVDGVSYPVQDFTHWKPLKLSAPPKPEISQSEQAFTEFYDRTIAPQGALSIDGRMAARLSWQAALKWANSQKDNPCAKTT